MLRQRTECDVTLDCKTLQHCSTSLLYEQAQLEEMEAGLTGAAVSGRALDRLLWIASNVAAASDLHLFLAVKVRGGGVPLACSWFQCGWSCAYLCWGLCACEVRVCAAVRQGLGWLLLACSVCWGCLPVDARPGSDRF